MPTVIGARLRELRIAAQLSQQDVAQQVGVTKSRVSQWETDEEAGIDSHKRLEALAQVFGVTVADLMVPPRFTPPARVPRRVRSGAVVIPLPARIPPELLAPPDHGAGAPASVAQSVPPPATLSPLAGLTALQQAAVDALCKACRAGRVTDQQALAWLNEWHALATSASSSSMLR